MKKIKKILSRLKLATRYQKTFAGKTSDLIAYLGYKLCPDGSIGLRLKEQGSSPEKIRSYLRRIGSGLRDCTRRPSHTTGHAVFSIRRLNPATIAELQALVELCNFLPTARASPSFRRFAVRPPRRLPPTRYSGFTAPRTFGSPEKLSPRQISAIYSSSRSPNQSLL